MWKNAQHSDQIKLSPEGNGWRIQDQQKLECVWFEGKQTPSKIFIENDETLNEINDNTIENESLESILSSAEDEDEFSWMINSPIYGLNIIMC